MIEGEFGIAMDGQDHGHPDISWWEGGGLPRACGKAAVVRGPAVPGQRGLLPWLGGPASLQFGR